MAITYTKSCTNMKCRHFGRIWSGYQIERFRSYAWEWLQNVFTHIVLYLGLSQNCRMKLSMNYMKVNYFFYKIRYICKILDHNKVNILSGILHHFQYCTLKKKVMQLLFPVQTLQPWQQYKNPLQIIYPRHALIKLSKKDEKVAVNLPGFCPR